MFSQVFGFWLDQIEVQGFKSASQLCMLDLVYEMIVGCASNCVDKYRYIKHDVIEKAFLMTRYETLMTLIGWRIIANRSLWKHIVPLQYSVNHHTK